MKYTFNSSRILALSYPATLFTFTTVFLSEISTKFHKENNSAKYIYFEQSYDYLNPENTAVLLVLITESSHVICIEPLMFLHSAYTAILLTYKPKLFLLFPTIIYVENVSFRLCVIPRSPQPLHEVPLGKEFPAAGGNGWQLNKRAGNH